MVLMRSLYNFFYYQNDTLHNFVGIFTALTILELQLSMHILSSQTFFLHGSNEAVLFPLHLCCSLQRS